MRWVGACTGRESYAKAMAKGDPEMKVLSNAKSLGVSTFDVGGVVSAHRSKE